MAIDKRRFDLDEGGITNQHKFIEAIGSFQYVATTTRPDIVHTTGWKVCNSKTHIGSELNK